MITTALNTDIRLTDPHRYKFDSAMAEYLYELECDDWTGSTEWAESVQLFGKRLLFTDDRGFVTVERYETEAEAQTRFDNIDEAYGEWLEETEEGWL